MKGQTKSGTVKTCRAGIIAALYAALTMLFGELAYGPLQIRPAEALCLLPLFFAEAVPGLFVGCLMANFLSGFGILDVFLGSLITLVSAILTYFSGKILRGGLATAFIGGIAPVLLNAAGIPVIIILAAPTADWNTYLVYFWQLFLTQSVWVYGLGVPLYLGIKKLKDRGAGYLL